MTRYVCSAVCTTPVCTTHGPQSALLFSELHQTISSQQSSRCYHGMQNLYMPRYLFKQEHHICCKSPKPCTTRTTLCPVLLFQCLVPCVRSHLVHMFSVRVEVHGIRRASPKSACCCVLKEPCYRFWECSLHLQLQLWNK